MLKILNSKGEEVTLNVAEQRRANVLQLQMNNLGIEISVTTLTQILKGVVEQKFFEVSPSDYFPVVVGEGQFMTQLLKYRAYDISDDFESGLINQGAGKARLAQVNAGVDTISIAINNWAKQADWNIFQVEQAAKSGSWELVSQLAQARKRNWDLGVQRVAFLGLASDSGVKGWCNQSSVNSNTTRITKPLKDMTGAELKAFCSGVLDDYRSNCNRSAWPDIFAIPESDYLGLATYTSEDFPIKSVLAYLEETFKIMTKKPNFKILPLAYLDSAYSGLGLQRYVLASYDQNSGRMDVPLPYTNTQANTFDGFTFSSVGYGQFTGYVAYRPLEMLYFDY